MDGRGRHAGSEQQVHPFGCGAAREFSFQNGKQHGPVLDAFHVVGEARVGEQVLALYHLAQGRPQLGVGGADDEVAVCGLDCLVRGAHAVGAAQRRGHAARAPKFGAFPDRQSQRGLEQRGVDVLALARLPAADHGAQDGVGGKQGGAQVGKGNAGFHGRAAGLAHHAHGAAAGLGDQVQAGAHGPGAGLAEARDAGIDQARVDGLQRGVVDLQPRSHAGAIVLDEHVGAAHQFVEGFKPLRVLQVDLDAALVAVQREEAAAVLALEFEAHGAAGLITHARCFDLDHVGAHVAQQHAAIGAGHDLADVEYADSGKWKSHCSRKKKVGKTDLAADEAGALLGQEGPVADLEVLGLEAVVGDFLFGLGQRLGLG